MHGKGVGVILSFCFAALASGWRLARLDITTDMESARQDLAVGAMELYVYTPHSQPHCLIST
jgi:hypothetical protein